MTKNNPDDSALADRARALPNALDPVTAPADDPHELRRIGLAKRELHTAEAERSAAGEDARANGHTWAEISMTLGVTRQAAQSRFGTPATV